MWGKETSPQHGKKRSVGIIVLTLLVVVVVVGALLWNVVGLSLIHI